MKASNSVTLPEPVHEDVSFESSDLDARGTLLTALGVVIGLFIIIAIAGAVFFYLLHVREVQNPTPLPFAVEKAGGVAKIQPRSPLPPAPRLQASPRADLKGFEAQEDWMLNHYAWVDRSHGTVAIPIERAIEIVAKRGIPPATGAPNPTNTPPVAGTRDTGLEGTVEPEPR